MFLWGWYNQIVKKLSTKIVHCSVDERKSEATILKQSKYALTTVFKCNSSICEKTQNLEAHCGIFV